MKRYENILIGLVIIFLTIHLFTIHSKLLYHLTPDKIIMQLNYKFNLDLFRETMLVSSLTSLAYSISTALILTVFVKYNKVFILSVVSFALLDGIGVYVYYNIGIEKALFIQLGSLYYSVYTMFIVIALGWFRNLNYKDEGLNNKIDGAISESNVMQLRDKVNRVIESDNLLDKIMNLRAANWSQSKIAKELKISQPKVSRILAKYADA